MDEILTRKLTGAEWTQVRALFDTLIDLPPATREARLKTAELDPFIAAELRSLLAADRPGVLDGAPPTLEAVEPLPEYASLASGTIVGGFRIDRLIGRGGMGEVYLAHRESADFEQRVALKMLRPEAVGHSQLFDAERRLLAGLEHPGIARLIDGGIAPDGRPYMALEYVEGREITAWCAEQRAGLATRLKLFLELCDAVGYAHARLVVHRDIKPSNILVDEEGRARLLDFGVARLIDTAALDRTMTQALLTPDYAAPEQFGGGEPTVAADIYALGAVLFELLTARRPFGLDGAPLPTVLRRLLHDDPPLPSRVASDVNVPAARIAGDLDAIVLKAMRRAPAERYSSAAALAEDVQRHLGFRPVRAREGSTGYAFRRFLRRNRWAAAATAAGLAALLVGAGGIAWQARETRVERDIARAEAERSEAVNQAMMLMFREAADQGRAESVTARELIDTTAKRLAASLDPAAAESADVVGALSDLYVTMEDVKGSQALLEAALARGIGRGDPIGAARLKLKLAATLGATRRFAEARRLLASADRVWQTDPERFRVERVQATGTEAYMLRLDGKRQEGIALLLRNMPDAERAYAGNSRDLATRYANLVTHLVEANRLDEAEALIRRGDAMLVRSDLTRSPAALTLMQMRGSIASRRDDLAGAEAIFRRTVATRRELYGRSVGLAVDLLQHARSLIQLGRPAEALVRLDEAEPMAIEYFGAGTQPVLMTGLSRAEALAALGRLDEADRAVGKVAPGLREHGSESLLNGALFRTQALLALERGDLAASSAALNSAEAIFRKIGPAAAGLASGVEPLRKKILAAGQR